MGATLLSPFCLRIIITAEARCNKDVKNKQVNISIILLVDFLTVLLLTRRSDFLVGIQLVQKMLGNEQQLKKKELMIYFSIKPA